MNSFRRRDFLRGLAASFLTLGAARGGSDASLFKTPYKYGRLVLSGSNVAGEFDSKMVDCPFVFHHDGRFYQTYIGYDGTGYQTGLAVSDDLTTWKKLGCIFKRDPNARFL